MHAKERIFAFQFAKSILQTILYLIQYMVLEIHFWSVKCCLTTVTVGYAKILSILIPSYQAVQVIRMGGLDENKPLQNAFKRI